MHCSVYTFGNLGKYIESTLYSYKRINAVGIDIEHPAYVCVFVTEALRCTAHFRFRFRPS
jgi:hypothetical protein